MGRRCLVRNRLLRGFSRRVYRHVGTTWHPGVNVGMGKDHTLFALEAGAVAFRKKANGRTYVSVNPTTEAAE